ncbi:hemin uptake protein HemP [Paraburkholderia sp. SARCC-3016]|uniref:hemin uptake protein HemP n=1 Tax=Paraburkholderia sp. SARCC-3016 TaxID=3058611 RepID=UPI002806F136|nr:hemin uptake protein HemP [Paraburkholderia sp. SARCC-3016]MDQ7977760.1 hemin uptake protein HemP [Paraburkholderia sp. SARCC-3016]
MTNVTRPSTLSLRRPAAQALTTSRASKTSAPAATPTAERAGNAAAASPESSAGERVAERVVRSETLLQGRSHISITHNGETYQLRATRLGKLILTK